MAGVGFRLKHLAFQCIRHRRENFSLRTVSFTVIRHTITSPSHRFGLETVTERQRETEHAIRNILARIPFQLVARMTL